MKRALCIGLNYTGQPFELGGCENDARDLQARMKAAGINADIATGIYSAEHLFAKLNTYRTIQKKADTLYISFSGHGTQIPGGEADGNAEGICLWNGKKIQVVRDTDLNTALAIIPGSVVMVLDSCFSGGMDRNVVPPGMRKRFIPFSEDMELVATSPITGAARDALVPKDKLYYLQACGEDEVSYDPGENGLFTSVLCTAYDRATPAKRTIKGLIQTAQHAANGWQNPQYRIYGGSAGKKLF